MELVSSVVIKWPRKSRQLSIVVDSLFFFKYSRCITMRLFFLFFCDFQRPRFRRCQWITITFHSCIHSLSNKTSTFQRSLRQNQLDCKRASNQMDRTSYSQIYHSMWWLKYARQFESHSSHFSTHTVEYRIF